MNIEQEITKIQQRNTRVERDKAWEKSKTRTVTICVVTYLIVLAYNILVSSKTNVFITSAVPVIGFFLSTLGLPVVRKIWTKTKKGIK